MNYSILFKAKILSDIIGIQGTFLQGEIVDVTNQFISGNFIVRSGDRICYASADQIEILKGE